MKSYSILLYLFFYTITISAQHKHHIIADDVTNFWAAYDKISASKDSITQYIYLKELYLDKATPGLNALNQARNYTPQSYISAINSYPLFWKSVRNNTFKYKKLSGRIENNITKLKKLYPSLKPAQIYFSIGALRTGGTTLNDKVLIGSELAFADKSTVTTEFPGEVSKNLRTYFDSYSDDNLVLLSVHEYIHTQQKEMVNNLLSQAIYEGVAEFISVLATKIPSSAPIAYGKLNETKVKLKFEEEMFNIYKRENWLWSSRINEFGIRDLGYYIGYELCERHYNNAQNKKHAVKELIELDYTNEDQIEKFVDNTKFFSASVQNLFDKYQSLRPTVTAVSGIINGSNAVTPKPTLITITFSEQLDTHYRNFDYGPLGESTLLAVKNVKGFSEDGQSITIEVDLLPGKHYQMLISNGFRTANELPLLPYLLDFKTLDK